jgi:hypothetical protein
MKIMMLVNLIFGCFLGFLAWNERNKKKAIEFRVLAIVSVLSITSTLVVMSSVAAA